MTTVILANVKPLTPDLEAVAVSIAELAGVQLEREHKRFLDGENDFFGLMMSADLWIEAGRWALKSLGAGALTYVGGQIASRVAPSRNEKLTLGMSAQLNQLAALLEKKTAYDDDIRAAIGEVRAGLKATAPGDSDREDATIALNTRSEPFSRERLAKGVLDLAAITPVIEQVIAEVGRNPIRGVIAQNEGDKLIAFLWFSEGARIRRVKIAIDSTGAVETIHQVADTMDHESVILRPE